MDIGKLEKLLGYKFSDPDLLLRALSHRSWAARESIGRIG